MNQEDLNALMRNPWEAAKKPRPQPLPECPQCGERYCGDGIAFCTECANTVTPNSREALTEVQDLIGESSGVYGLHLNGDESPWSEVEQGGRFERLTTLQEALAAIDALEGE